MAAIIPSFSDSTSLSEYIPEPDAHVCDEFVSITTNNKKAYIVLVEQKNQEYY